MSVIAKRIAAVALSCVLLLAAGGCKASAGSNAQGSGQNAPQDDGSVWGIVTAVSSDSITIAVMQGMGGGQRPDGFGAPSGSGRPSGSGKPSGTPPAQGGQPDASGAPGGLMDTTNLVKKTYKIDADTKIVSMGGQDGAKSTTLATGDIAENGLVSITTKSGDDTAAAQIAVMQGGFGGQGGPGGPNDNGRGGGQPQATATTQSN